MKVHVIFPSQRKGVKPAAGWAVLRRPVIAKNSR